MSLRVRTLRLAASLPKDDPLRRKLLQAASRGTFELYRGMLTVAWHGDIKEYKDLYQELDKLVTTAIQQKVRELARRGELTDTREKPISVSDFKIKTRLADAYEKRSRGGWLPEIKIDISTTPSHMLTLGMKDSAEVVSSLRGAVIDAMKKAGFNWR